MKKLAVLALAAFLALGAHAHAQTTPNGSGGPVAAGKAMAHQDVGGNVAVITLPSEKTTFSVGTLGGELLQWLALVFGAPIASFIVLWVRAVAKKAGVDLSDAMSEKLQEILKRGLKVEAAKIGADLDGKLSIEVQNKMLAGAVQYAKDHGADTIKDLATNNSTLAFLKTVDPNDPKTQEALAARATAALSEITPEAVMHTDPAQVVAAAPAAKQDAANVTAQIVADAPAAAAEPVAVIAEPAVPEQKTAKAEPARPEGSPPSTI